MYTGTINFQIQAPADKVYQLLFEIENWDDLLPHCQSVFMEEADDNKQIAIMEIKNGKHSERIRTVRTFKENSWITFNQDPPPSPFSVHKGKWHVKQNNGHTHITVNHDISVNRLIVGGLIERVAWNFFLKKNSLTTLNMIKKRLE